MSKYAALGKFLENQSFGEIPMTFSDIEKVTGTELPPKAQLHRAWWSNSPSNNVMTKVWLDAGFRSEQVDMVGRKLVFKRAGKPPPKAAPPTLGPGMQEQARMFKHDDNSGDAGVLQPRRSPLFGAMKGTFTIEPGYDLTSPTYTDEEWAEVEKEMEADWDQIEQGMSGKKS